MNEKLKLKMKINLIMTKVEILKLKADSYNWACNIEKPVRDELEQTLLEINTELELLNN